MHDLRFFAKPRWLRSAWLAQEAEAHAARTKIPIDLKRCGGAAFRLNH
jgi:hypothetical protein